MFAALPQYAELHCLTNFSFLRGASHPEELVGRAAALGYSALAITDECLLAGVVRAHLAARETGLKIIVGTEARLADGPKLVLLAMHREGYGNLSALITKARRRAEKGEYRLERSDLDDGLPGCLALLVPSLPLRGGESQGEANHEHETRDQQPSREVQSIPPHSRLMSHSAGSLPPRLRGGEGGGREGSPTLLDALWLAARFPGRSWIAAELHLDGNDRAKLARLQTLSASSGLPLVAAGDVHMHVRSRKPMQDVLTAIRLGKPVAECGEALFPNAERHLRLRIRLARLYPPELLDETQRIAERCTFSLDELRYEYPEEIVPPGETPTSWLRKLTEAGLRWRFGAGPGPEQWDAPPAPRPHLPMNGEGGSLPSAASTASAVGSAPLRAQAAGREPPELPRVDRRRDSTPPDVRALVEHELALIADLRYEAYFLTVFDIVRFAREQRILCQGRGSAANSAVCYALGITEVDPARMSMLFERFISKERNEPPDIDVDFEHQRREEVIQYIYGKYGRDRAALTATVISYRTKSAIRDVGKALGLDLAQVDRLAKSRAWWDGVGLRSKQLVAEGFDPSSRVVQQLAALVAIIVGFPRHLSQHTGGFVIARGPLSRLVPIENAAMPERSVIQWDKDDLDALGLLKVDVLALGMLSAIRRALDLVSGYRGKPFGMAEVPPEDPGVYEMVSRGDTVGVFQIESRAQMSMLPRLRPQCFFDLVIEVAIVRPGPIQGGMVHPYLRRRNGEEPVSYPSEAVRGVLERTLGVPIFQEQVMQLAVVAAGFTPGEADRLRRAMAAWRRRGGLEPFEQRLKEGMRSRGYPEEFAEQIYRQILGFGEYGFPESHSASFALLVYVSSWLKRYEPAAFCAALLNSQPMGFYAPAQLVQDAQRHGVEVRPADVTRSEWECVLDSPPAPRPRLPCLRGGVEDSPPAPRPRLPASGEGGSLPSAPSAGGAGGSAALRAQAAGRESPEQRAMSSTRVPGNAEGGSPPSAPSAGGAGGSAALRAQATGRESPNPPVTPPTRLPASGEGGSLPSTTSTASAVGSAALRVQAAGHESPHQADAVNTAPHDSDSPALRLGFLMIKGFSEDAAKRIVAARRERPFASVADLARRAHLDAGDLKRLAAANALAALAPHRRRAYWDVAGVATRPHVLRDAPVHEADPNLVAPTEGEDLVADYASLGLTLGRHPLALLRDRLRAMRLSTAEEIRGLPHRRPARASGIVTGRQRPDTASGVVFVTLEDETGYVNVVVWATLVERQRRELLGARLMTVYGVIEREGDVVHLVARRLVDHSALLGRLVTRSRDFH